MKQFKTSEDRFDLTHAYSTFIDTVADLFNKQGEGFFVPLYQREYTWERDNINQLFDDLVLGILELAGEDGETATSFLGTTIFVPLHDKTETVRTGEERAQPSQVLLVIDGQQRISTIALLAIRLVARLRHLEGKLRMESGEPYVALLHHTTDTVKALRKLYAVEPGRGASPRHKPKIIRATEDRWTHRGDDTCYRSPVARYIARYIRVSEESAGLECLPEEVGRVRSNVRLIDRWLDHISDAHVSGTELHGHFPGGPAIASERVQKDVLGFSNEKITGMVSRATHGKRDTVHWGTKLYQLFVLAYYLLQRCVINRLYPTREEWGFDMFQALNATGTPLTAMETFLPQVMQAEQAEGNEWVNTPSAAYFDQIEKLFERTTSNQAKNKRTNDLLGAFRLCHDGEKLANRFSAQRRWMTLCYEKVAENIREKRIYVRNLAGVAEFYRLAWYMEDVEKPNIIRGLEDHDEGDLASFLVQYLKDANSKLSAPILARYYVQMLNDPACVDEFVSAAKACAAYFTLVRSARSTTSGLDDIYRRFFRGGDSPFPVDSHSWKDGAAVLRAKDLKKYFRGALKHRKVLSKDAWMTSSDGVLLYRELKKVVRFVLFVASHDRVRDASRPGLTKDGIKDVCPMLSLTQWRSKDLKSIEHVAPQNPPPNHKWESEIYSQDRVDDVGNLLLLPTDINKFAANKSWPTKYLHYCHLGVRGKDKIDELKGEALRLGITLSKKAVNAMKRARYSCVVEPAVEVGLEGEWNVELVNRRTEQIKEVTWKRLRGWLTG